jgi:hypothetical protein
MGDFAGSVCKAPNAGPGEAGREGESLHHCSSWPGSSRPSTSFITSRKQDVDTRDEPGHDGDCVARFGSLQHTS